MAGRLEGKVAVITGASRGLGLYCAVGYGREGATVVIAARTEEQQDERLPGTIYDAARLVEEAGGQAFPIVCNVGDAASIEAMAQAVLEKYGRCDVLMTNAGLQPPGQISTMRPSHWELEFKINVHGAFHTIRSFLPAMQAQKSGSIINVSSWATQAGTHYGLSKRVVEGMTETLAEELRGDGIAVNCLKPVRAIETPGYLFSRTPGTTRQTDTPPPDSYVEAAVLLALQTPAGCTGGVFDDAHALQRLADAETRARFKALNPPSWSAGL